MGPRVALMRAAKRLALTALTSDFVTPLLRAWHPRGATIFTLHRFSDPDDGVVGHSPRALREHLRYLRKNNYNVLDCGQLIRRLTNAEGFPPRTVAFAVDDGYYDFWQIAAPIFADYDCPVSVFVTTAFLDGKYWYWWDKLTFALTETARTKVRLVLDEEVVDGEWRSHEERLAMAAALTTRLKQVPEKRRAVALAKLITALDVDIPVAPPRRYSAMSWDQAISATRSGVSLGPHSVTHPSLPGVDDHTLEWEITESWRRLVAVSDAAVPVFCYPYGDFGERECRAVKRAGLLGALSTVEDYVDPRIGNPDSSGSFQAIPRFHYPDNEVHFVEILTGLVRLKRSLPRFGRDAPG